MFDRKRVSIVVGMLWNMLHDIWHIVLFGCKHIFMFVVSLFNENFKSGYAYIIAWLWRKYSILSWSQLSADNTYKSANKSKKNALPNCL